MSENTLMKTIRPELHWLKAGTNAKYNHISAQAFNDWMGAECHGKSI